MKTLTEFPGMNLKNAALSQKTLVAEGKTAEELTAALGEALKLEGDRLSYLMSSLEIIGDKLQDIKRVVIFTLAEGEKAPQGAVQKGEHYYLAEYYPSLEKGKPKHDKSGPGDRGKKTRRSGKKRGERGDRGDRGGSGDRRERKPRPADQGAPAKKTQ